MARPAIKQRAFRIQPGMAGAKTSFAPQDSTGASVISGPRPSGQEWMRDYQNFVNSPAYQNLGPAQKSKERKRAKGLLGQFKDVI